MADSSTSSAIPTLENPVDEEFQVKPPPSQAFTIVYNEAIELLLQQHGTVVKTYLALCYMGNSKRQCHPSLERLAQQIGADRKTVIRANQILEDQGLLRIIRPKVVSRGKANV